MILIGLVHTNAHAQAIPHSRTADYLAAEEKHGETYERHARPLRLAPKERWEFSRAHLGDVLRMLAAEAGISFVSHLDKRDTNALISITFELSPFSAMEAIAKDRDIELIPKEDGGWSAIYPASGTVRTVTSELLYSAVKITEKQKH